MSQTGKHSSESLFCDTCGAELAVGVPIGAMIVNPSLELRPPYWESHGLEWKTTYVLCLPCVKIVDDGYADEAVNGCAENMLDAAPYLMGVLSCSLDTSGNIMPSTIPLNYTRPVNLMRLLFLRSYMQYNKGHPSG